MRTQKELGISEELQEIFRIAIDSSRGMAPPGMTARAMTPRELREYLQQAYEEGRLETVGINTAFGEKTLKRTLKEDIEMIPPEYLAILQEYASKLEE